MTMDERIEAAARLAYEAEPFVDIKGDPIPWAELSAHVKQFPKRTVAPIIAAAFPELSGDKPTHWLAPRVPTVEMQNAALESPSYIPWIAMRDAYLGKGDGG